MSAEGSVVLEARDLHTHFAIDGGVVRAVDGVSFELRRGEVLGIVGESGCGKSATSLSIMGLVPKPPASHPKGEVLYRGTDLLRASEAELRKIRGNRISMIFQDPMTSLNPYLTVARQLTEVLELHRGLSPAAARVRAAEMLVRVGIAEPGRRLDAYPHELSGGMRQRVMIAMALACEPEILIADEPTTALDVTIQAQILTLIKQLQRESGTSVLLITHDLGVVAGMADRVLVMYAGRVIEAAPTEALFRSPAHPFSAALQSFGRGLLPELSGADPVVGRAARTLSSPVGRAMTDSDEPLLQATDLAVHFPVRGHRRRDAVVRAVDGVCFTLRRGETLGLVGESGCGKSTAGRALLQLLRPTAGSVRFDGVELTALWQRRFGRDRWRPELRALRSRMQMIFQDPYASLDPRMTVEEIVGEPLRIFDRARGVGLRRGVQALLEQVGMDPRFVRRYPHEFSGGQRQRIGIARALALQPELLVCDEPISALDVSVQAQTLNLLLDLQARLRLTYLFIAHDIAAVRHVSDRIAVMYLGRIVELGGYRSVCEAPAHPYTRTLIAAVPVADPGVERTRVRLPVLGEAPSPIDPPSGCHFHPRCPDAVERCRVEAPQRRQLADGRLVACHLA
jgi:peptide/nickel transport system ATP-binding protein